MGPLHLDGNSSKVEATTYNCYKVDMECTTHEIPIPCAFEFPSSEFLMIASEELLPIEA
jgi:hypothetical protein